MKIKVVLELDIEPTGSIGKLLKEKTLILLEARKRTLANEGGDNSDLKAKFDALNPELERLMKSTLPFADYKVENTHWESTDLVPKDEENSILAPKG